MNQRFNESIVYPVFYIIDNTFDPISRIIPPDTVDISFDALHPKLLAYLYYLLSVSFCTSKSLATLPTYPIKTGATRNQLDQSREID